MSFETSVADILPLLTQSMRVRCHLKGELPAADNTTTPSPSNGTASLSNGTTHDDRNPSPSNLCHVEAVTISRDNVDLASVTNFASARSFADLSNMEVRGQISGNDGTDG